MFSRQQVDPGEGVGFAPDWVCRKQGGVEKPRIRPTPGPVAEKPCCGAVP
jgi:hypothetical protein